jgi:hypothetical protein
MHALALAQVPFRHRVLAAPVPLTSTPASTPAHSISSMPPCCPGSVQMMRIKGSASLQLEAMKKAEMPQVGCPSQGVGS